MTKLKTKKKMNKSTIAIIIMAVVMVAMLAFGGTYAYFTATSATRSSEFHVGKVALKSNGTFATLEERNVVPGDPVLKGSVTYTNESNVDTYIAVVFDILYKGGYYVYDSTAKTWERKETKDNKGEWVYKNLTNYQIDEAFGSVLAISNNGIIDGKYWVKGGAGNENIYMMRASEGSSSLIVEAPIDANTGAMKEANDRTTTFVKASDAAPVKISKALTRKYQEEIVKDAEGKETGTAIKMVIPAKDYLNQDWSATNNIYLEWEDADIQIQFTAYQIQAAHIKEADDTKNDDSFAADANIDTIWAIMKTLVGYGNTTQNFITA